MLGVLRSDDSGAPLVPEPGLDRLPGLVASVTSQGLDVSLTNTVEDAPKPVQLAVYRIAQESLTNVLRHSGATRAVVDLEVVDGEYVLTVGDNGSGFADVDDPAIIGRGLLGMRERAELLGGTLETGRSPSGGAEIRCAHPARTRRGGAMTIRVAIADDQQLIRAGFRSLLEAEPDIEVVGEAGTGTEAVALVTAQRPDVVLMDIRMPDGDGLWATEEIVANPALAGTHIVIVTTFELDEYVARAIKAGASGFLVKDTEPVDFLRAVRVVAAGDALLSPGVTEAAAGAGVRCAAGHAR